MSSNVPRRGDPSAYLRMTRGAKKIKRRRISQLQGGLNTIGGADLVSRYAQKLCHDMPGVLVVLHQQNMQPLSNRFSGGRIGVRLYRGGRNDGQRHSKRREKSPQRHGFRCLLTIGAYVRIPDRIPDPPALSRRTQDKWSSRSGPSPPGEWPTVPLTDYRPSNELS
jgi:hypothetical protein